MAVGFTLAAGVLIAVPVTGGFVNSAWTLGPEIVAGEFTNVWVFIFAPVAGGVVAALLYDRFITEAEAPE